MSFFLFQMKPRLGWSPGRAATSSSTSSALILATLLVGTAFAQDSSLFHCPRGEKIVIFKRNFKPKSRLFSLLFWRHKSQLNTKWKLISTSIFPTTIACVGLERKRQWLFWHNKHCTAFLVHVKWLQKDIQQHRTRREREREREREIGKKTSVALILSLHLISQSRSIWYRYRFHGY